MDDVPPEFRKVLEHSRRQGQRRMGAGSTIGRLTNFEETEEERQRRAAAGGADGRLTDNYHQLLVAVHQLEQLMEKPELKLQEMKAHFVDDLWEYVFKVGHYSSIRDMREAGYLHLVQQGVYTLSSAGREYLQQHAAADEPQLLKH
jgi:hypothetical protein